MVDLVEHLAKSGKLKIAAERPDLNKGADVKIDEQSLTLDFANGSQIRIFAADDQKSQERARGSAPHVVWVDEAQKYPNLDTFINEIVGPSLKDYGGELWLSGTPSEWLDGALYSITKNEDEAAIAERASGWEVHEWSVLDNPWFGSTPEERWERAIGEEMREKNIDVSDPPPWVLREWFAKWTKTDARFVYSVHRWPSPLTFAPLRWTPVVPAWMTRLDPSGKDPSGISGSVDKWYDHAAAVRDLPLCLPETDTRIEWFFGLGVDFGYNPDPFALVLWAFSPTVPDLYEMVSWKRTLVLPDWQRDAVRWFFDNIPALVYADGDPGGLQGAHLEGWRELLGIPIDNADKSAKRTWQELINNDGERGRVHMRDSSVYLHEMRHLAWRQQGAKLVESDNRKLADGTIPGRDCCDAGLYSYRRYVSRRTEETAQPPKYGSPEWYALQERTMRDAAIQASARQLADEDEYDL